MENKKKNSKNIKDIIEQLMGVDVNKKVTDKETKV